MEAEEGMPKRFHETLSTDQRRELEAMRDHHAKGYLREKAAAILKMAEGQSGRQVAQQGLLKARDCDTVYRWWHRYQHEGLSGLLVRKGRGRKPAFFPPPSRPGKRP
jgi:transposase